MDENIERVLAELDGFRMADEMTYAAYSRLHDLISGLDDLLKAQEPRVMTLEEVKRSTGEIVWAERWGTSETIVAQFAPYDTIDDSFYFFTIGNSVSYKAYSEDYYKDWRCWTSRPTDEQRKAAKWE